MGVSNTISNIRFGFKLLAKILLVKLKDRGYKTLQYLVGQRFFSLLPNDLNM
jgi:hypothetical protein